MKLGKAIEEVQAAETRLARELTRMAERHGADPDVFHLSHLLARRCGEHLRRLEPMAERYGAKAAADADKDLDGSSGVMAAVRGAITQPLKNSSVSGAILLKDLRRLYTAAQDAEITWVMLLQGALAARDAELVQAAREIQEEAQHRWQWVRTRIKETSPQVYAVS
jgi:hypothetical protein